MNLRTLRQALSEYSGSQDQEVAAQIKAYGPILLKTAEAANSIGEDEVRITTPSKEQLEEARKGGRTIMDLGLVEVDASAFAKRAREIAEEFAASDFYSGEFKEKMRSVDFSKLVTEEDAAVFSKAPMQFIERISSRLSGMDELLLSYFIFPVIKLTMRIFLDKAAIEASRMLDASDDPVVDHERSLNCPFCGGVPGFAAVVPTPANGSSKRLYCSVCGGWWKFERIRCAVCGDEAVSDLKYVHEETDDKHRLHVCSQCSSAFPTLFSAGDELTFNPDVESIVLSGLYSAYEASHGKEESASE